MNAADHGTPDQDLREQRMPGQSSPPRWLDRLAHDLRGPLMPLQTASYLLRNGQLEPERQQELFELIERQTRRLAHMLDELGDWSHASQHSLLGVCEPCEPALLLDNAIGGAGLAHASRPVVVDDTGEVHLQGDPARLTQLLRTLIEYVAVRATAAQVRMTVAGGRVRIDVLDPHARPDPGQLAMLLLEPMPEPFDEGLGLRLLIAREIATAHAGTLTAAVDPDGGLRLRCELPLAAALQP